MKWISAASLGLAATAMAADPPAGCSTSRDGKFQVSIYSIGDAKRSIEVSLFYASKGKIHSKHVTNEVLETSL